MTSSKQRSVIAWINPSYIWVVISHPQHTECLNLIKARWAFSHCGDNWKGTLFSWLYIFYAHLAFVRFEHSVCCWSIMATYITYITLLALFVECSLVHWHQQCVTKHHVPKCMSCRKAIVVIRAHCFRWTHGQIAQSIRVSEQNSVVVGSNPTQVNFL